MEQNRVILVGGGAASGKSTFALTRARQLGTRRLFLATAQAGDAEMVRRIEHHRLTRGDDFDTVEEPIRIPQAIHDAVDHDVVVLDCLTLWLTNLLLEGMEAEVVLRHVDDLCAELRHRARHVVIVTNEVGMGIVPESELGRIFRDLAGRAHQRLSRQADEVYVAILGTTLRIKPAPAFVAEEAT